MESPAESAANTDLKFRTRCRVAVVDDHAIIRSIFKTVIEDDPALDLIWSAATLAEARSNLARTCPDLLILDIHLPDGSGYSLAHEIAQRLPEVRVLIVSSHRDKAAVLRARECGARGYVPKSSSPEQIFEAIDVVRRGDTYFR